MNTDEFDIKDIAPVKNYDTGIMRKRVYDTVDCGKPGPEEYFKLYNLGKKGLNDFWPGLITKKKDSLGKDQTYIIVGNQSFREEAAERIKRTQSVRLAYGITSDRRLFIWPLVEVTDVTDALTWHITGWEIAEAGLNEWTQVQSDKKHHRYIHLRCSDPDQIADYDEFHKPPLAYKSAVNRAFKGRVIKDREHIIWKAAGAVVKSQYVNEKGERVKK